jgi:hypothetical protein
VEGFRYQWDRTRGFSAIAQVKGRFCTFPKIIGFLKPQNAQVWRHEFFKWLKERCKIDKTSSCGGSSVHGVFL